MNVLLLSMPDSFEHMPAVAIRMPNGALASLAGNIDRHHRVAIADLILVQASVRPTLERLVREIEPDVVGLSVMTFQRGTALEIARLLRTLSPRTKIVVGGYDPSLAPHAYEACAAVDFIVRGEGELTLRELIRALEGDGDVTPIRGLSYRGPRRLRPQPGATGPAARVSVPRSSGPRRQGPRRLHAAGTHRRRRRDVARLHLRLQLLLDHRDARQEFPPLSHRSRARGHRRREGARRPIDLSGRRQHHAQRLRASRRSARRSSTPDSTTSTTPFRR